MSDLTIEDCIFPDCQIKTDFGKACEHSCPFESEQKQRRREENSIEHHVAMHVTGLASEVVALNSLARDPKAEKLLVLDMDMLTGAHRQLGRLLARLPTTSVIAAE